MFLSDDELLKGLDYNRYKGERMSFDDIIASVIEYIPNFKENKVAFNTISENSYLATFIAMKIEKLRWNYRDDFGEICFGVRDQYFGEDTCFIFHKGLTPKLQDCIGIRLQDKKYCQDNDIKIISFA